MIDRTLKVIPVNDYEAVTVMTVGDLLSSVVPARNFLPNARVDPLDRRVVDRLRELHGPIQRDFSGEKKTNARGPLADYISDKWLRADGIEPPAGFIPTFILYFPDPVEVEPDGTAHLVTKGIFIDGESRGEALLINIERLGAADYRELIHKKVAVHIIHGVNDLDVIGKYFADVNGKGVRVNPNRVAMADYTDPYAQVAKRVFEQLGYELEIRQRQVSAKSQAVLTGLQARTMVAAVARGMAAIQYGAKSIPLEGVDFERLELTAETWLTHVFERFGPEGFRDKSMIVRATPVSSSLGALGKAFYDNDSGAQRDALDVLSDDRIDWSIGPHWAGIAGRVNPTTDRFAVGGGKEYAYATHRALVDPTSDIGRQIRGLPALADVA